MTSLGGFSISIISQKVEAPAQSLITSIDEHCRESRALKEKLELRIERQEGLKRDCMLRRLGLS